MDRHVIVICEECGRKYRVDPDRILGRAAGFNCRSCGHSIRVVKPTILSTAPVAPDPAVPLPTEDAPAPPAPESPFRRSGIGLRAKAWLFWFLVPGSLLGASAFLLFDALGAAPGLGGEDVRLVLPALAGGLLVALAVGLAFGLRLVDRIDRLAAAAERAATGAEETVSASNSGDDLDRVAAAVRVLGRRLRSQGGRFPPSRGRE
jgi:hypothetical protein